MVQEPPKAEGVVLDLIHFLAQINVGKSPTKANKNPQKSPNKNQANNKAQQKTDI